MKTYKYRPRPRTRKPGMNKTETRYATELEAMKRSGQIIDWKYESVQFTLAPRTTYTPDFFVVWPDHFQCVEIKGFLRDDAAVKFKTAAAMYPWIDWMMIRQRKSGWETVYIFDGT